MLQRRPARRGDGAHRLHKLSPRAGGRRRRAALVEPAPVFEVAGAIIAKEFWRADRAIGARDLLRLVVQLGKREAMHLRELLHLVEGVVEIGLGVVRADASEADALELERARIGDEAVDHR